MGYYDKIYDRATTKSEVLLSGVNRVFHKVTTSDDPVIPQVELYKAYNGFSNRRVLVVHS
jgi:translation initiation factor 3 subunit D